MNIDHKIRLRGTMSTRKLAQQHPFKRKLSKEEINKLPLRHYSGKIHLISSHAQLKLVMNDLNKESIFGFDTETKPSFQKGVTYLPSLLQLASRDSVYLFQLRRLRFPKGLMKILANPNVSKVGVALEHDIKKLKEVFYFKEAGFVDLRKVAINIGLEKTGLRNLAANLLGLRISKNAQLSNWARDRLSPAQMTYAATDAWISRELYLCFKEELGMDYGFPY